MAITGKGWSKNPTGLLALFRSFLCFRFSPSFLPSADSACAEAGAPEASSLCAEAAVSDAGTGDSSAAAAWQATK